MPNPIDSIYADGTLYDIQPSEAAYSGRNLTGVDAIYAYSVQASGGLYYDMSNEKQYQIWKHNIFIGFSGYQYCGGVFFTLPFWKSDAFSQVSYVLQLLNNSHPYAPWPIVSRGHSPYWDGSWPNYYLVANGGGFYSGVNVQYCAVAGEYWWHGWDPKSNIYVFLHATGQNAPSNPYQYEYGGWQGIDTNGAVVFDVVTA